MKLKKLIHGLFRFFVTAVLLAACLKEETRVAKPKAESTVLSFHNFNIANGNLLPYSAPDLIYFKQETDSTYIFTITSNFSQLDVPFEKYGLARLNNKGALKDYKLMSWPGVCNQGLGCSYNQPDNNSTTTTPWNFFIDDQHLSTVQIDYNNISAFNFFKINPSTGEANGFTADFSTLNNPFGFGNLFTSFSVDADGNFLGIYRNGWYGLDDYQGYMKLSNSGSYVFNFQDTLRPDLNNISVLPIDVEFSQPQSMFLSSNGSDNYFLEINPTIDYYTTSPSFLFIDQRTDLLGNANFNFEIRFGPGKQQKAHRFISPDGYVDTNSLWENKWDFGVGLFTYLLYQDYVDVPFEVWDVTNNRQLMVSFRDRWVDGAFDLNDPGKNEFLYIHDVPYSTTPGSFMIDYNYSPPYTLNLGYYGDSWDPSTLPSSIFSCKVVDWKTRLISVNSNGIRFIKKNFISTNVLLESIFKVVPLQSGYAVLFNGKPYHLTDFELFSYANPHYAKQAQLVLLDGNFNQVGYYDIGNAGYEEQIHLESNGNVVYYASISGAERTIRLAAISATSKTEKNLFDIINLDKIQVEKISIAPRRQGGFALIAWVNPTYNTRDLLFLEFDDNLNLIKY